MAKLKITPLDLQNQEFGRTLRGYDPEEVRVFLELVSDEFEYLIKENTSLTERVRDLDEKIRDYRNLEKTLNATLISAQKNAESYYENAKKEADLALENARLESRKILEEARDKKFALEEEITRLQKLRQHNIKKLKTFLKEQLELLAGEEIPELDEPEVVEDDTAERNNTADEAAIPTGDSFNPTFSVDEDLEKEETGETVHYDGQDTPEQ